MNPFIDIIEEHVDEVTFLWSLRSTAVMQPQHTAITLKKLEWRIEKHLDGLMNAFNDAWTCCEQVMEFEDAGAAFVMAVAAIRSAEQSKVKTAVEAGMTNEQTFKGLTSALGWLPAKYGEPWIKRLLDSDKQAHHYLAIAACSVRRLDPKDYLTKILTDDNCVAYQQLYARALRLAGELKRLDLLAVIQQAKTLDNPEITFWANWASLLLGERAAVTELKAIVLHESSHQSRAIDIAFRILPVNEARSWISELAEDANQMRSTIKATAVLGDPHPIKWLISKMQIVSLSRIAGEAFTTITGIDLEEYQLTSASPQQIVTEEKDDPDLDNDDQDIDDLSMDDENLVWPNAKKVAVFWHQHQASFIEGQRYFLGKPIEIEHLKAVLKGGRQCHRHAAALEMALLQPTLPYPNTKAKVLGAG